MYGPGDFMSVCGNHYWNGSKYLLALASNVQISNLLFACVLHDTLIHIQCWSFKILINSTRLVLLNYGMEVGPLHLVGLTCLNSFAYFSYEIIEP